MSVMIVKNFKIPKELPKNKEIINDIIYENASNLEWNGIENFEFSEPVKNKKIEVIEVAKNVKGKGGKLF